MIGAKGFKEGRVQKVLVYERDVAVSVFLRTLLQDCGFSISGAVTREEDLPAATANYSSDVDVKVISHPRPLDALKAADDLRSSQRFRIAGLGDLRCSLAHRRRVLDGSAEF